MFMTLHTGFALHCLQHCNSRITSASAETLASYASRVAERQLNQLQATTDAVLAQLLNFAARRK